MTTPAPEPQLVHVPAPLQWGTGIGQAPDGSKVCALQLVQAQLTVSLQLTALDMKRLAADLAKTAAQAESGLILPPGTSLNGAH